MFPFTLKRQNMRPKIILRGKGFTRKNPKPPTDLNICITIFLGDQKLKSYKTFHIKLKANLTKRSIVMSLLIFQKGTWSTNLSKNNHKGLKDRSMLKCWKCFVGIECLNASNVERVSRTWVITISTWTNILKRDLWFGRKGKQLKDWWILMNGLKVSPTTVYNNSISFILQLAIWIQRNK